MYRGLQVYIYRTPLDADSRGITGARHAPAGRAILLGPFSHSFSVEEAEARARADGVPLLLVRQLPGLLLHAVPAYAAAEQNYTSGGSFVYTDDSRFSAISRCPIPVWDVALAPGAMAWSD